MACTVAVKPTGLLECKMNETFLTEKETTQLSRECSLLNAGKVVKCSNNISCRIDERVRIQ